MGRPKYWWDGTIRKGIRMYYAGGLDTGTIQGAAMHIGITRAMSAVAGMVDGRERLRVIELCFMRGMVNVGIAADRVHVSERTAQRWISEFVRMVGKEIGYI